MKYTNILSFIFFIIVSIETHASQYFSQVLEEKIKRRHPHVSYGLIVQDVQSNIPAVDINADRLYVPSSSIKVITYIAALLTLGPDKTFVTELKYDQASKNLYVKFVGDPTLYKRHIISLFTQIREKNLPIKDVIIDRTVFSVPPRAPGWMLDDVTQCYAVPVDGIILNENAVHMTISPSKNGDVSITSDAESYRPFMRTSVMESMCSHHISILQEASGLEDQATFDCLKNDKPFSVCYPVEDLLQFSTAMIGNILQTQNIKYSGSIIFGKTPNTAVSLASHASQPISEMMIRMMKKSDNLIANAVFLATAYNENPNIKSWDEAGEAIKKILRRELNIDTAKIVMHDGSGLSRYNLITPRIFASILHNAYALPKLREPLLSSMPHSGKDGTLAYRLNTKETMGKIKAKTGTMTGIISLAGYIFDKGTSNHPSVFITMMQGYSESSRLYRRFEDEICHDIIRGAILDSSHKSQPQAIKTKVARNTIKTPKIHKKHTPKHN